MRNRFVRTPRIAEYLSNLNAALQYSYYRQRSNHKKKYFFHLGMASSKTSTFSKTKVHPEIGEFGFFLGME